MQLKVTMLLKTQSFMYIFTVHRKPHSFVTRIQTIKWNVTLLFKTQSFVYVFTVHRKPTAMLRGHNAPIFFLHIADDDDRIYSLSTDRSLKVGSPDDDDRIYSLSTDRSLKVGSAHCWWRRQNLQSLHRPQSQGRFPSPATPVKVWWRGRGRAWYHWNQGVTGSVCQSE